MENQEFKPLTIEEQKQILIETSYLISQAADRIHPINSVMAYSLAGFAGALLEQTNFDYFNQKKEIEIPESVKQEVDDLIKEFSDI